MTSATESTGADLATDAAGVASADRLTDLRCAKRLEEYRRGREHIFRSEQSLLWYVRKNRAELVEAGALVMLVGQWHAVTHAFDRFVLQLAQRDARLAIGRE